MRRAAIPSSDNFPLSIPHNSKVWDKELLKMSLRQLKNAEAIIPPLRPEFRKGSMGRVAVIGGCKQYTGAPYFAATAGARLGCDVVHIICTDTAGPTIKTFSPNLIVHPILREGEINAETAESIAKEVQIWTSKMDSLVVGPGLGRDDLVHETVALVIQDAITRGIPMVIDADALAVVRKYPAMFHGRRNIVLTPNLGEARLLYLAYGLGEDSPHEPVKIYGRLTQLVLSLHGPTVILKDREDCMMRTDENQKIVSNTVRLPGSAKRCAGQGDTLAGCVGTLLAWHTGYHEKRWPVQENQLTRQETVDLAVWTACILARRAAWRGYFKKGRGVHGNDICQEVQAAFDDCFAFVAEADEKLVQEEEWQAFIGDNPTIRSKAGNNHLSY